jgi:molybdenum cofactor cytidylyltransferase
MRHWRSFAIVPAAGSSVRMGRPKLLLPWKDRTVIECLLSAWQTGGVTYTIVISRPDDVQLASLARSAGAEVAVPPVPPPEMKDSVRFGLEFIAERYKPEPCDVWLLAPADMPQLSVAVIQQLLSAHDPDHPHILMPVNAGKRGHPALFPWGLAEEARALQTDEGVNAISKKHGWIPVPVTEPWIHGDLDTPEDYERQRRAMDPRT